MKNAAMMMPIRCLAAAAAVLLAFAAAAAEKPALAQAKAAKPRPGAGVDVNAAAAGGPARKSLGRKPVALRVGAARAQVKATGSVQVTPAGERVVSLPAR